MRAHLSCRWTMIVVAVASALQFPFAINAQDAPEAQPQSASFQDPPSRVVRLSSMEGTITFQPAGEDDWVPAMRNRPLVTGDALWADENSRAELHIGSTALHLGANTAVTFLDVSDQALQISLAQGSFNILVRHLDDQDTYEIDTPNVAFTITQPGNYRLDVDPDGTRTDVIVRSGQGEASGGGSTRTVAAGQRATFTGSDQLHYDQGRLPETDGFDTYASNRDQAADQNDQADSANYVSPDMTGYEDLDAYGSWSNVDGYGMTWQPNDLAVGWAPYRFGNWVWVGPWGWTWVAAEPWGFAPFHYGRWAFAANRWVWVPGPAAARPVYAPHLVAWVGGGPGSNFNFSFGAGVGWLPLAPGEVFVPGYRVSRNYVTTVNLSNTQIAKTAVTNIYNSSILSHGAADNNFTYANRGVSGGVTVVSRDTFVNARPVAGNVVSIPAKEIDAAPISHLSSTEPGRTSVAGSEVPASTRPPAALSSRTVVALRTPPATAHSLIRPAAPGHRTTTATSTPAENSSHTLTGNTEGSGEEAKTKSRVVWEAEGTPQPEKTATQPQGRNAQRNSRTPQPAQTRSQAKSPPPARADEQSHSNNNDDAKSANPRQQKPAAQPQRHQSSPHAESAPKK